jgi:hypothetical protein
MLWCCECWPAATVNCPGLKTQAASRLHAVLATLLPGGMSGELSSQKASRLLRRIRPKTMVETERKRIAHQDLAGVRRREKELKASRGRLDVAVAASGTGLTDIYGVGSFVAGATPRAGATRRTARCRG